METTFSVVEDIRAELLVLAARRAGGEVAAIDAAASIRELGIDSLGLAEFLFDVDDAFGIELGNEVLSRARCLNDLAEIIASMGVSPAVAHR